MLIPIKTRELEKMPLLMYAIGGAEYKLYSSRSDFNSLKNAFIDSEGDNSKYKNYKYLAITTRYAIDTINILAYTYDNKYIIESDVVEECVDPAKLDRLYAMLLDLAKYYKELGYDIDFKQ